MFYFIPFVYFSVHCTLCIFVYFIITAALCVLINGWMDKKPHQEVRTDNSQVEIVIRGIV